MIRYKSSRGDKIDGTKPNQTGYTGGDQKQGRNQTEGNGQNGGEQRITSPERVAEETNK